MAKKRAGKSTKSAKEELKEKANEKKDIQGWDNKQYSSRIKIAK
jgi:hypothetical protein